MRLNPARWSMRRSSSMFPGFVVDDEDAGVLEDPRGHVDGTTARRPARSALTMLSAAGESGHTSAGAAVYAACASAPWKNAVSDA